MEEAGAGGEIDAASAREVGVEKIAPEETAAGGLRDRAGTARETGCEADDVVEAAGEIFHGDVGAVVGKFLLDAGVPGFAFFGFEVGIAGAAGIAAEGLGELRLDDAFAVGDTVAGVSPETLVGAVVKSDGGSYARGDAGAEIFVGFGAGGKIERNAADRLVAEVEVAALIVAAEVADAEEGDVGVFDFVLVAGGGSEVFEDVGSASVDAGAVEAAAAAGACLLYTSPSPRD